MSNNTPETCTICNEPVKDFEIIGDRVYCKAHASGLFASIPPLWHAQSAATAVLIILAGVLAFANATATTSDLVRLIFSITTAFSPLLTWLIILFLMSLRRQMTISTQVITISAISMLVAAAISRPFLYQFVGLQEWLTAANPINRFVAHITIESSIHVLVLYAILRFAIWRSEQFVRVNDGYVYALAAGWSYASMLTGLDSLDIGGYTILEGNLRILTQISAYVSVSLVIGLFIGRNRFIDMQPYYLPAGVLIATGLLGSLLYAATELNRIPLNLSSDGFSPWPGFVVNLIGLLITTSVVSTLSRRFNRSWQARQGAA
nr:hypothetical protein [Anaerolineae bacterium]